MNRFPWSFGEKVQPGRQINHALGGYNPHQTIWVSTGSKSTPGTSWQKLREGQPDTDPFPSRVTYDPPGMEVLEIAGWDTLEGVEQPVGRAFGPDFNGP